MLALVAALALAAPPANVPFDYQIGAPYDPPAGVGVVSRDWFAAEPAPGTYSICYVNAFQTQDDEAGVARPDERLAWPPHLVLTGLGDDPEWGGEYLIDIRSAAQRRRAADWVQPMIETCARKGYDAVEYDNLDSFSRSHRLITRRQGIAFAKLLAGRAHDAGLPAGQKNFAEWDGSHVFDFAVAEECARWRECDRYQASYGRHVLAIEYRREDFRRTCNGYDDQWPVVLRNLNLTPGGVHDWC